jgi:hypothetical protein
MIVSGQDINENGRSYETWIYGVSFLTAYFRIPSVDPIEKNSRNLFFIPCMRFGLTNTAYAKKLRKINLYSITSYAS